MKTKQSKRMETTQPSPTQPSVSKMLRQGLKCRQFIWEMAPGSQSRVWRKVWQRRKSQDRVFVTEIVPITWKCRANSAVQRYLSGGRKVGAFTHWVASPALLRGSVRGFNSRSCTSRILLPGDFGKYLEAKNRINSQGSVDTWSGTFSASRDHALEPWLQSVPRRGCGRHRVPKCGSATNTRRLRV